jgi:hypothetical protein
MPEHLQRGGRAATLAGRTAAALSVAGSRRDARAVLLGGTLAYLLVYLVTIGDLGRSGAGPPSVRFAADASRALASTGFFRFDAVAVASGWGVTYLFSPVNLLVALVLAGLVGANLALTYLGVVQPRACGLEASTGVVAGVPALLSGAACCGPTILLVVGVQASAAWIGVFQFLVPLALAMLVGSLLLIGRQVDPALL